MNTDSALTQYLARCTMTCPKCLGDGADKFLCALCQGIGRVEPEEGQRYVDANRKPNDPMPQPKTRTQPDDLPKITWVWCVFCYGFKANPRGGKCAFCEGKGKLLVETVEAVPARGVFEKQAVQLRAYVPEGQIIADVQPPHLAACDHSNAKATISEGGVYNPDTLTTTFTLSMTCSCGWVGPTVPWRFSDTKRRLHDQLTEELDSKTPVDEEPKNPEPPKPQQERPTMRPRFAKRSE